MTLSAKPWGTWTLCASALAAALAPGCGCDPCAPPAETALDYATDDAWLCRPGLGDGRCAEGLEAIEVRPDGSLAPVAHSPAAAPPVDCFYVYPTMDLRLGAGVHTDFDDNEAERGALRAQAARFGEVCQVYAPLYRQATLGTYATAEATREVCFDLAFSDVLRAFRRYLEHDNQGRGVVLIGHSQGAQNVLGLLQELFDDGAALAEQLVAALPIGWAVGVARGQTTGGDLDTVPVCRAEDETGCLLAYRSFAAGNDFPTPGVYRGGEEVVCTNPADLEGNSAALLSRVYLRRDLPYVDAPAGSAADVPYLLYRDFFRARCVAEDGDFALEISVTSDVTDQRTNPVRFNATSISGSNGTHIVDMQFGQGDLIELVGRKIEAYSAAP